MYEFSLFGKWVARSKRFPEDFPGKDLRYFDNSTLQYNPMPKLLTFLAAILNYSVHHAIQCEQGLRRSAQTENGW